MSTTTKRPSDPEILAVLERVKAHLQYAEDGASEDIWGACVDLIEGLTSFEADVEAVFLSMNDFPKMTDSLREVYADELVKIRAALRAIGLGD